MTVVLRRIDVHKLDELRRAPVDAEALATAREVLESVRTGGDAAVRAAAERFGELPPDAPLVLEERELARALEATPSDERALLERATERIRAFAHGQRASIEDVALPIPGGRAGHSVTPIDRVACYAPGGRYPLPSSVLMTVVTARVAGVAEVWVASPKPARIVLAAAAVAGADALLAAGGPHAIGALAYGTESVPAVDLIAGPGSKWVSAAKQLVYGHCGIDMIAGPTELVLLCDDSADPGIVAADMLAQAEHAPDARPVLVATHAPLVAAVERELEAQLETLPTAEVARLALANGFAVVCDDVEQALAAADALASEHLSLHVREADRLAARPRHYGAIFIGQGAAEVFGDYGAGPNHVLPTAGAARYASGLSVLSFLRVRPWMRIDDPAGAAELCHDAAAFARLEGLEAHARAAERRRGGG
ncbi:MAG: histidinol dehydrogenase [Polyangiaceae bacterium]|nr:histidinol dehydrogenase [Polyangiaceae bacterium]